MTLKRLYILALTLPLLAGCAATLTLRNERPGTVKNIEVKAAGQSYTVAELAAGASDERKLKIPAAGDLNVNYVDEKGRSNYTSSKLPLKKGDSRHWILRLTEKDLLEAEIAR